MMFLLTCDKKLTKSQLSPTHASTERKITDELKHNAGWYEVREGSPVKSSGQSVGRRMIYGGKDLWNRCVCDNVTLIFSFLHYIFLFVNVSRPQKAENGVGFLERGSEPPSRFRETT